MLPIQVLIEVMVSATLRRRPKSPSLTPSVSPPSQTSASAPTHPPQDVLTSDVSATIACNPGFSSFMHLLMNAMPPCGARLHTAPTAAATSAKWAGAAATASGLALRPCLLRPRLLLPCLLRCCALLPCSGGCHCLCQHLCCRGLCWPRPACWPCPACQPGLWPLSDGWHLLNVPLLKLCPQVAVSALHQRAGGQVAGRVSRRASTAATCLDS
jgi:hypothetical protein